MKKKSSIVKLSIIGVLIVIGLVLSFATFNLGFSTYNSFASSIKLGLELEGGIYAIYEGDAEVTDFDAKMEKSKDCLYSLFVEKGYAGVLVTKEGADKLRVEIPQLSTNDSSLLDTLGKPADLKFVVQGTTQAIMTSEHVKNTSAGYYNGGYIVGIELTKAGDRILKDYKDQTLEIITTVDGTDTTQTTNITAGVVYISGFNTSNAASDLADQIMTGTFGASLKLVESSTVPPTYGDNIPFIALMAAIVVLVLVLAFMGYKYRLLGAITALNLLIYGTTMLFFLAVFPWMLLSLAGIAALLIGLAIILDGNIIVFNRVKNEYRNGKSIISSTHYGFKKSIMPVVDANVVVLLFAIVVLIFPTGSLKALGFALIATTLLSALISLFITRKLAKYFFAIWGKNPSMFNLERSEEFAGLGADETAGEVQQQIDAELKSKARAIIENENADQQVEEAEEGVQDESK